MFDSGLTSYVTLKSGYWKVIVFLMLYKSMTSFLPIIIFSLSYKSVTTIIYLYITFQNLKELSLLGNISL